jgi:hypothetical protein
MENYARRTDEPQKAIRRKLIRRVINQIILSTSNPKILGSIPSNSLSIALTT